MSVAADRRTLLAGGLLFGAFGLAEWLRPRRFMHLLGSSDLDDIVPMTFGDWRARYDPSLVVPPSEGSLADRLYGSLLTRRYQNVRDGRQVMLLIAYGASQTDDLQLHRPETCYPAVGLPITDRQMAAVSVPGATIPAVALTAAGGGRQEDMVYWSRMGSSFPRTASAQRAEKLQMAFQGLVPDGALVRASSLRLNGPADTPQLERFLGDLITAMPAEGRRVLIG